jgi:hypothetical protein
MDEWINSVTDRMDQVNPGEWSFYVEWVEDGIQRQVRLRPKNAYEVVCGAESGGCYCLRRANHPGRHVPSKEPFFRMDMILEP